MPRWPGHWAASTSALPAHLALDKSMCGPDMTGGGGLGAVRTAGGVGPGHRKGAAS